MKYRLLTLSLIALFAFAGAAFADEAATGMEAVAAPAAATAEAPQAVAADASCGESQPALPFVTDVMAEAKSASCGPAVCRQQCYCPGCFKYCVDLQTCECECVCP